MVFAGSLAPALATAATPAITISASDVDRTAGRGICIVPPDAAPRSRSRRRERHQGERKRRSAWRGTPAGSAATLAPGEGSHGRKCRLRRPCADGTGGGQDRGKTAVAAVDGNQEETLFHLPGDVPVRRHRRCRSRHHERRREEANSPERRCNDEG